jgi:hypothetical protein
MGHWLLIGLVIWAIYHFTVASHNYTHVRRHYRHRSFLSRIWISASFPLPWGFRGRLGHRA